MRRERRPRRSDRRRRQFGIYSENLPIEVKFSDGTPGTAFPTILLIGAFTMKVVVRKKGESPEIPVVIGTEFIKLESALKLANAVPSGGQAKVLIQDGEAKVNGEVCLMRGKKLYPGDRFEFMGQKFLVCVHEPV